MKIRPLSMKTSSFVIALLFALAAGLSPSLGAERIKVLLVTGGHGFETEAFHQLFSGNPELAVTRAEHAKGRGASAYEREDLLSFDVVVAYDMPATSTEAQRAKFKSLFAKGVGYVGLHHALLSFADWPEYGRILGVRYQKIPAGQPQVAAAFGYQHDVNVPVQIVGPANPITAGVRDFMIHDEIYWGMRTGKDTTPFLSTTHPKSMNPLGWTRVEEKSRVVGLQLGHDHKAYENHEYRRLLSQAIRWAALGRSEGATPE